MPRRDGGVRSSWLKPVSSLISPDKLIAPSFSGLAHPSPNSVGNQISTSQPQPMTGGIDPVTSFITSINTNAYLIGTLMILMNLGGRFLTLELTKEQEAFLQNRWLRPLLFFTIIFVATRNVIVAFWISMALFFILWVVANETSPFCLIPGWHERHIKNQVAAQQQPTQPTQPTQQQPTQPTQQQSSFSHMSH
jgi:hypothetical protein